MTEVVSALDWSKLPTNEWPAVAPAGQEPSPGSMQQPPEAVPPQYGGRNPVSAGMTRHASPGQLDIVRRAGVELGTSVYVRITAAGRTEPGSMPEYAPYTGWHPEATLHTPARTDLTLPQGTELPAQERFQIHSANFTVTGQPVEDIADLVYEPEMRALVLQRARHVADAAVRALGISPRERFRDIWRDPNSRERLKMLFSDWHKAYTNYTTTDSFAAYFVRHEEADAYKRAYADYLAAYRSGHMQVGLNAQALQRLRDLTAATQDTERYLASQQQQASAQYYAATLKSPGAYGEQRRQLDAETLRLNDLRARNQAAYAAERSRLVAELAHDESAPVKTGRVSIQQLTARGILLAIAVRNTKLRPAGSWMARATQLTQQLQARHKLGEPVRSFIRRNETQRADSAIALQPIRLAMAIRSFYTLRAFQRHERRELGRQAQADMQRREAWLEARNADDRLASVIRAEAQRMAALRLEGMEARHRQAYSSLTRRHAAALHPKRPADVRRDAKHNIAARTEHYQGQRGAFADYNVPSVARRILDWAADKA